MRTWHLGLYRTERLFGRILGTIGGLYQHSQQIVPADISQVTGKELGFNDPKPFLRSSIIGRFCFTGVLLLLVGKLAFAEVDKTEEVVSLLQSVMDSHDQALSDFDASIEIQELPTPQFREYSIASDRQQDEIADFLGAARKPHRNVHESHTNLARPEYWRFLRNRQGQIRIDSFSGPPNQDHSNIAYTECLQPTHWEKYWLSATSGSVSLSSDSAGFPSFGLLGLVYPDHQISRVPIKKMIASANELGQVISAELRESDLGKVAVVQFLSPDLVRKSLKVVHTLTVSLSLKFPVELETRWGTLDEAGKLSLTDRSSGCRVKWEDFREIDGVSISHRMIISRYAEVVIPTSEAKRFLPLMKDGNKVTDPRGLPLIDPSSYRVERYYYGTEEHLLKAVSLNPSLPDPLCNDVYPAGTIIQNDATGEVFQLTGPGRAVDSQQRIGLTHEWWALVLCYAACSNCSGDRKPSDECKRTRL